MHEPVSTTGEGSLVRGLHPAEGDISHPLPDELAELVADRFRVLGDVTRIRLLDRLREGEATVVELTDHLGTTQQNVSKHLGLLQRNGIVTRRKQGVHAYYRIIDESVFSLCDLVCGSLRRQIESLGELLSGSRT
jgi:DNA-binding transcriptional ArsR family regulator